MDTICWGSLQPRWDFDWDKAQTELAEARRLYGWRVSITRQKRDAVLIDEMDSSLFYTQMGWRPQYTLADTVDWLLETYTGAAKQ